MLHENEMDRAKPNGVAYWRGTVDSRLKGLEDKIDADTIKIDKVLDRLTSIEKAVGAGKQQNITWEFIREKMAVPLMVGLVVIAIDLLLH